MAAASALKVVNVAVQGGDAGVIYQLLAAAEAIQRFH